MKWLAAVALIAMCVSASANVTTIYIPEPIPEPTPAKPVLGDYGRIHSVAVISLIGDRMLIGRRQFIVSLQMGTRDISDWKIDEENVRALHHYLSGRYSVRVLDQALINSLDRDAFKKDLTVPYNQRAQAYRKHLGRIPNVEIDAFIIVRSVGGAGGIYYAASQDKLYADYFVEIVDARDFTVVSSAFSRIQEEGWRVPRIAIKELRHSVNFNSEFETSAKEWDTLHRETLLLTRRSLVETLRALEMQVTLPKSDDPVILEPPPAVTP